MRDYVAEAKPATSPHIDSDTKATSKPLSKDNLDNQLLEELTLEGRLVNRDAPCQQIRDVQWQSDHCAPNSGIVWANSAGAVGEKWLRGLGLFPETLEVQPFLPLLSHSPPETFRTPSLPLGVRMMSVGRALNPYRPFAETSPQAVLQVLGRMRTMFGAEAPRLK